MNFVANLRQRVVERLGDRAYLLELFIFANLAFLTVDVALAHSINQFRHPAEWIPVGFSAVGPLLLIPYLITARGRRRGYHAFAGHFIGALAIVVGLAGMLFHLDSQFFEDLGIKTLVYTAPFAAPLAYTGLGFLLVLNRMVDPQTERWCQWVIFFAVGGFFGNFVLALCDHAQNGFFHPTEWIPVVAGAVMVGFLLVGIVLPVGRDFWWLCLGLLGLQVLVGLLGFYFHAAANIQGYSPDFHRNMIYGAPIFAPLLFPNLAVLGALGIWQLFSLPEADDRRRLHDARGF